MEVSLDSAPSLTPRIHAVDEDPCVQPRRSRRLRQRVSGAVPESQRMGRIQETQNRELVGKPRGYHQTGRGPEVGRIRVKFLTIPDILLGKVAPTDLQK